MQQSKTESGGFGTSIGTIAFASAIGTTIEWYDFFLFGVVTPLVLNKLFFPNFDPLVGTLLAYTTFFVGFISRPIGGIIFGHYGDRIGRKTVLVLTILIMFIGPQRDQGYWLFASRSRNFWSLFGLQLQCCVICSKRQGPLPGNANLVLRANFWLKQLLLSLPRIARASKHPPKPLHAVFSDCVHTMTRRSSSLCAMKRTRSQRRARCRQT